MPLELNSSQPDFEAAFTAFLDSTREAEADVDTVVAAILDDVKTRGDAALLDYTKRFDRLDLETSGLRLEAGDISDAMNACDNELIEALELAATRIEDYHRRQLPGDTRYVDAAGVTLGARWTPVTSAGLYVPGGTAAYPSSVLMNAIPARVAGVERLAMVVPTPDGEINPLVLAAAKISGIGEIYRPGGGGAGFRHPDGGPGGQNRGTGKRLCGGRQAPGLWNRGHRHDRRALGNPGGGRQGKRSRLDRN